MHYHLLGLRIRALVHLLTYLYSWLGAYKTGNIPEKAEDRGKLVSINGLYKVVHGLSIAAKCMTLNDLCARFKAIYSLNAAKWRNTA